ncbi:MAG: hypothetical protein ACXWIN_08345, partial [Burkholderiaceae bacterium]
VVQGLAAAVCFWAWRETQLRGWRLLGAASAVRIVGSLPHFFTLNLYSGGDLSSVARWYWVIGVVDWASTIVASLLFLGGLYVLADGVRRLRAPAIEQPPMQRYSP